MGAGASEPAMEVWPPDWEMMEEDKRKMAREAILAIPALTNEEFLAIDAAAYVIPKDAWKFDDYHAAAAAAVQEDIKLNKIIYRLVPRKLEESEFWRLYFSEVLFVLECVKVHGVYPPPPPPPPPPPEAKEAGGTAVKAGEKGKKVARPPPEDEPSCAVQ